jgi:hypothetical protein
MWNDKQLVAERRKAAGLLGSSPATVSVEIDADLFSRAEKELAAFVVAVNVLDGEEHARAAADDWLLELTELKGLCKTTSQDLRSVTIRAATLLARNLSVQISTMPRISVGQNASCRDADQLKSELHRFVV